MIQTETSLFKNAASSHPGMTGKQNEDRFLVTHFWTDDKKRSPSTLAVLCDGIGGHRAGEAAAEIGVRVITESVADGDPTRPLDTLEAAVNRANRAIYTASISDRGRLGMGATCACAWIIGDRLFTVNLGDSRIYLMRDEHIIQLTTDHTWIQEALDAGILTDPALEEHPNAHVIRRYLGSEKPPEPDFRLWVFEGEGDDDALANQGLRLMAADTLLLCSDGLTDLVSDEEIQEVVQSLPLDQAPERLISLANARGGHDNTTVILLRAPGSAGKTAKMGSKRRLLLGCLAALIFISLLIALGFIGLRWRKAARDDALPLSPSATLITLALDIDAGTQVEEQTPQPTLTVTIEGQDQNRQAATRTPWPTNTTGP
jgi:PPM family protein phosphatase